MHESNSLNEFDSYADSDGLPTLTRLQCHQIISSHDARHYVVRRNQLSLKDEPDEGKSDTSSESCKTRSINAFAPGITECHLYFCNVFMAQQIMHGWKFTENDLGLSSTVL